MAGPSSGRGGVGTPPRCPPGVARAKPALGLGRTGSPERAGGGEARLTVQVQPRAARNEIVARSSRSLRVRVTAPPAGGAANDGVRTLLSELLDRPRSAVRILRGHSARTKLVGIAGISTDELRTRLAALAP